MKYVVEIKEVHIAVIEVEAKNEEEAREKAENVIIDEDVEANYCYTMDSDDWNVVPREEYFS